MARKGLPKAIIKKYGISKKAWNVYRGRKKSSSRVKKVTKRRRRSLGRRKRKRGSRKFTIPLAPVLGLAAGLAKPLQFLLAGQAEYAVVEATRNYTGYDMQTGQFWAPNLMKGLFPLAIGLLVHKFVGGAPLNANRMLAAANVPIIRI